MNNRDKGHNFERWVAKELKEIFPFIATSRAISKERDDLKIDFINKQEVINGILPHSIQCKSTTKCVNYVEIMKQMATLPNTEKVIIHQLTETVNGRNVKLGVFVILEFSTYKKLIKTYYATTDCSNTNANQIV